MTVTRRTRCLGHCVRRAKYVFTEERSAGMLMPDANALDSGHGMDLTFTGNSSICWSKGNVVTNIDGCVIFVSIASVVSNRRNVGSTLLTGIWKSTQDVARSLRRSATAFRKTVVGEVGGDGSTSAHRRSQIQGRGQKR